ncbi:MAG: RNA 2',3'-cyclic phosphodiesterase [Gemmatimonadetes bacterium]|nr:RNA 2',3'-cyclic phosphodiesterase [Gemmatimonadota bacterium]
MRLFVALNLPAAERDRMYEAAAALRAAGLPVRWVEPEFIHLTLKFLGAVAAEQVERVQALLDTVAAGGSPVDLALAGCGAFPSVQRPRVIWVGAEAVPQLASLQEQLERGFESLGFRREQRAYHPHITLGRAHADARPADFRRLPELVAGFSYQGVLPARTLDLMQSRLSPAGARYEVLTAAPLAGGAEDARPAGGARAQGGRRP